MQQLKRLLLCMLKVGSIGFGGGNALIPFIEKEVVTKYGLVSREEFNKFVVLPLKDKKEYFKNLRK